MVFKKFKQIVKLGQMTQDHLRNAKVLVWACILNLSFAAEKLCNVLGHPQPDSVWLAVYGGLATYTTYLVVRDYVFDVVEEMDDPEHKKRDHVPPVV